MSWHTECENNHAAVCVCVFQIRELCLAVKGSWQPNVSFLAFVELLCTIHIVTVYSYNVCMWEPVLGL